MGGAAVPQATVLAVCTGRAVPFARGRPSAIHKTPVPGRVRVAALGLQGDAQGDPKLHGGVEKAVHHYAWEHYAAWRDALGAHAVLDAPGAFGENLHSQGLTEATVCLGDRWRVGTALLEVTQARQPCWKLNERFGVPDMARRVQQSLRTGWYSRVVEDGELWSDAAMVLEARPHPAWTLERLLDLLYRPVLDGAALQAALALPLPASWQRLLQRRLDSGAVEDWAPRLDGPPA
ncbi:MAG: MOSC domain-containing protein [Burkholderiaceae bacterium]